MDVIVVEPLMTLIRRKIYNVKRALAGRQPSVLF